MRSHINKKAQLHRHFRASQPLFPRDRSLSARARYCGGPGWKSVRVMHCYEFQAPAINDAQTKTAHLPVCADWVYLIPSMRVGGWELRPAPSQSPRLSADSCKWDRKTPFTRQGSNPGGASRLRDPVWMPRQWAYEFSRPRSAAIPARN